eukprot:3443024-Rhodomonas_salina.1
MISGLTCLSGSWTHAEGAGALGGSAGREFLNSERKAVTHLDLSQNRTDAEGGHCCQGQLLIRG